VSYQAINYQKTDRVMMISLIGPVDDQTKLVRLCDELTELCNEITRNAKIRVIILAGAGEKSFSIKTDSFGLILEGNDERRERTCSLSEPIAKLDLPIIAAIHGDAIGQGLELALACDLRLASETSHFGLLHIRTGLIPWDGGTQRLSRLVGRAKALEMILTGEVIDAQEACRIGLVNKMVPSGELMTVAMDMAKEIASKGPIALRYAKEAVYQGMDMTLGQGLRLEADLYLLLHTTQDRAEGIQSFRKKRVPQFEGK